MILDKDERIETVVNVRVNFNQDLTPLSSPIISTFVDSNRDDLANITRLKEFRTHVFLRGNVREIFNIMSFSVSFGLL